jgi:hypothetical protein
VIQWVNRSIAPPRAASRKTAMMIALDMSILPFLVGAGFARLALKCRSQFVPSDHNVIGKATLEVCDAIAEGGVNRWRRGSFIKTIHFGTPGRGPNVV